MIFYKKLSGFDNPRGSFLLVLESAGGYLLAVLSLGILSYLISGLKSKRVSLFLILLLGIIGIFISVHINVGSVFLILRGMPVILAAFVLIKFYQFFKESSKGKDLSDLIFGLVLSTYALILLFKILLFVTPFHYGFVLAVPGALIMAVILTNDFACLFRGRFYYPKIYRALAIILLIGVLILHFRLNREFYGQH